MKAEETGNVVVDDAEVEMSMDDVQELMDSMGVQKMRPTGFAHYTKKRATTVKRKRLRGLQRAARKVARRS